jgi:serine/threonine protein kinase
LQTLLNGGLPTAQQETVIRHVQTCACCQRVLDGLSPAGGSWEHLAAQLGKPSPPPEPVLQRVLDQAKELGADNRDAAQTVTDRRLEVKPSLVAPGGVLAFLSPPTKPGNLGQLDHYEIHNFIGNGAFGIVIKGFDQRLHRIVAIKVLTPGLAANSVTCKRFIREARALAAVKNEHVVGIYEVQHEAQPPYLVMEYVDGISLKDKIDKHGALQLPEIVRIGKQIADGLAAAHELGVVHRDIKPANILLEHAEERVKIIDFGLARGVDDANVTQSGVAPGTPLYMSPEQALGQTLDHRSDLFSLGTVLYTLCTGQSPFRADHTMGVLQRVIAATPLPIRDINSEIPQRLCDIIEKLHAKIPDERFQTAAEIVEQFEALLQQISSPAPVASGAAFTKPHSIPVGMPADHVTPLKGLANQETAPGYNTTHVSAPNEPVETPFRQTTFGSLLLIGIIMGGYLMAFSLGWLVTWAFWNFGVVCAILGGTTSALLAYWLTWSVFPTDEQIGWSPSYKVFRACGGMFAVTVAQFYLLSFGVAFDLSGLKSNRAALQADTDLDKQSLIVGKDERIEQTVEKIKKGPPVTKLELNEVRDADLSAWNPLQGQNGYENWPRWLNGAFFLPIAFGLWSRSWREFCVRLVVVIPAYLVALFFFLSLPETGVPGGDLISDRTVIVNRLEVRELKFFPASGDQVRGQLEECLAKEGYKAFCECVWFLRVEPSRQQKGTFRLIEIRKHSPLDVWQMTLQGKDCVAPNFTVAVLVQDNHEAVVWIIPPVPREQSTNESTAQAAIFDRLEDMLRRRLPLKKSKP